MCVETSYWELKNNGAFFDTLDLDDIFWQVYGAKSTFSKFMGLDDTPRQVKDCPCIYFKFRIFILRWYKYTMAHLFFLRVIQLHSHRYNSGPSGMMHICSSGRLHLTNEKIAREFGGNCMHASSSSPAPMWSTSLAAAARPQISSSAPPLVRATLSHQWGAYSSKGRGSSSPAPSTDHTKEARLR